MTEQVEARLEREQVRRWHRMTGAYALHDDEQEAFERHLASCEACTQEAAELSAGWR